VIEKFLKFTIKIFHKILSKFEVKNQKINWIDHLNILALSILAKIEASIFVYSFIINELLKFIILSVNIVIFMSIFCNCIFVKCWLFLLRSLRVNRSFFPFFQLEHQVKINQLLFFFIFLLILNLRAINVIGLS
jgi:hypothetical protein